MPSSFSKFRSVLGPRLELILFCSIAVGITVSFVELLFAYSLQSFLFAFGIAKVEAIQLPDWIPSDNLTHVLIFLLIVTMMRGLMQWLQLFMKGISQEEFKAVQRARMLEWVFASSSASSSRVTTLFNERTNQAALAFMYVQLAAVHLAIAAGIACFLFYLQWKVTLFAFMAAAALGVPMTILNRKIKRAGANLSTEWAKTNTRLMMGIKNLLLLRIYNMVESEETLAKENLLKYRNSAISWNLISGFFFSAPQIVGVIIVCAIALFSREYTLMPNGVLITYFYLFVRFMQTIAGTGYMLSGAGFQWPQIMDLSDWWQKTRDELSATQQERIANKSVVSPTIDKPFGWKMQNVSFKYENDYVLRQFNESIQAKDCCVIMGPSGSGKSTLLNLILGQIKTSEGKIELTVDGQTYDLNSARSEMLQSIGYVGAESFLIEGTIRENILFGLGRQPTDEEIHEKIKLSECQFIFDLKDGLEHKITEQGQGLSAGQKQRLGLLRALMRNPNALILDEATANLDYDTEERLIETFAELKKRMTLIIVTHRPGSKRIADKLVNLGSRPASL